MSDEHSVSGQLGDQEILNRQHAVQAKWLYDPGLHVHELSNGGRVARVIPQLSGWYTWTCFIGDNPVFSGRARELDEAKFQAYMALTAP